MNNKNSISVCIIAKNESEVIERCLSCVIEFADEIIVVDTGSSDDTKELAQKMGAKVFDFVWKDDFSLARNYAFSLAKCDYIMWIDADDVITTENIAKIKKLKNVRTDVDMFFCKYITSWDSLKNPEFEFYRERIVKRIKNYKWQGFVHECIVPSGKISYENISIEHRKIKISADSRNLYLYEKHRKNGAVFNAREQYYYAKELYYNKKYQKSARMLNAFLKMKNAFLPNVVDALLTLARIYMIRQNFVKAIKYLIKIITNFDVNAEVLSLIGECFYRQKKKEKAIMFYQMALMQKSTLTSGEFVRNEYLKYVPLLNLTMILFEMGDYKNAKKYHLEAKKYFPNDKSVLYNNQFFNK